MIIKNLLILLGLLMFGCNNYQKLKTNKTVLLHDIYVHFSIPDGFRKIEDFEKDISLSNYNIKAFGVKQENVQYFINDSSIIVVSIKKDTSNIKDIFIKKQLKLNTMNPNTKLLRKKSIKIKGRKNYIIEYLTNKKNGVNIYSFLIFTKIEEKIASLSYSCFCKNHKQFKEMVNHSIKTLDIQSAQN
jgi:hypothetical protein